MKEQIHRTTASSAPVLLVAGGSGGIGLATAQRFAREGWKVAIASNDSSRIGKLSRELTGEGHSEHLFDMRRPEQCLALAANVREQHGEIRAIVNSAGISEQNTLLTSDFDAWDRQLQVMLYGSLQLFRACVPLLANSGRIIQIASIHHERVAAGSSAYGIAKAALVQMTRSLAVELAPRGILANAVAPGFVSSAMSIKEGGVNELESEWFHDNYVRYQHLPLKRAASPEEIAGVVWFLAGPDASYMTGSVVTADGGLTITF